MCWKCEHSLWILIMLLRHAQWRESCCNNWYNLRSICIIVKMIYHYFMRICAFIFRASSLGLIIPIIYWICHHYIEWRANVWRAVRTKICIDVALIIYLRHMYIFPVYTYIYFLCFHKCIKDKPKIEFKKFTY